MMEVYAIRTIFRLHGVKNKIAVFNMRDVIGIIAFHAVSYKQIRSRYRALKNGILFKKALVFIICDGKFLRVPAAPVPYFMLVNSIGSSGRI